MKSIKLVLLLYALLGHASCSLAEDTDIYSGGSSDTPNVLMVMDTGANFSSNAANPCTAYASGGAPSLGGTGGGVEQCALVDAIESLPLGAVNIGLMVNNGNNFTDGAAAGVGPCIGSEGGCLVKHLTLMDAEGKSALISFIKSWKTSGSNSSTEFNVKSGGDRTGSNMQEAWAYYTGKIGLSGKDYVTNILDSGCQKNFIIDIGNSFSNSGGPGDTAQSDPNNSSTGLPSAQVAATAAQKIKLSNTVTFKETTCGVTSLAAGSAASDWSNNWADEWARYMRETDGSSTLDGTQKITTYTIGVINNGPNDCKPDYPALLSNMATYGGGKYFQTGNASEVKNALLKILNEVQAVNSVFSASSLPVSVNAQGTYLNQIYMGMFRPDETGAPRWLGNMKQYSFVATRNPDTHLIDLSLGDSLSDAAISSGGTGFISPNSVSYWTCGGNPSVRACSPVADPAGGFWVNHPQSAGGAYDLPDGELVEKGGAAQVMRLANLTADYATTAGLSTNPRKLYTYCPSGASCNADLTDSANAFATTNAGITASMFGSSSSLIVNSIVRTGTTALVTTNSVHGYADGASVTISGAEQSEYNVTQAITGASGTTFTITGLPDYPTTPSTGAYTASLHGSGTKDITDISVAASTTANANGCASGTIPNINCVRVTVTVPGHGYSDGAFVVIAGVSPAQYSGSFFIANVTVDTFTYDVSVTPTSPSVNAYSVKLPTPAANTISEIKKVTGDCTVFANTHGYSNGASVTISGNSDWNGTYTVASATTNTFEIALNCNSTGTGGNVVLDTPTISIAAGNISRDSATATTATAVAASAVTHNATYTLSYVSGSGSNESQYVTSGGSRSIVATCASGATCTTFTFPLDGVAFSTTLTTSTPTVALSGTPITIDAGKITRSGTTATVSNVAAASAFATGQYIDIGVSGASVGIESAYLSPADGWEITCDAGCDTSFTFGPVTLSPATPATGAVIRAYQGSTPPDRDSLINWVRGHDNFGDEPGPGGSITVRPSFHGDVLHSRPVAINYGGTTGVVVFYGANDGVYRAVNGNQSNHAESTLPVPGSELWGFVPPEFFGKFNRQRTNSPVLLLPSTLTGIEPTPERKDYFADGSTSVYQLLNADGTTDNAYIYLAMRRGGDFIYALDVSDPASPEFLWKIEPPGLTNASGFTESTDFAELGETWSAPKVARIKGYNDGSGNAKPVMIFGAGYSTTQDTEPATADIKGRGIYIVDAETGALVWRATYGASPNCTALTTPKCTCAGVGTLPGNCTVAGMDYSIPADITLMDRDSDGYIDRLYAVDVGGNVWRVDLQREGNTTNNTPDYWKVNQVASLGGGGVPLRKFFYPPDVLPTNTFDAVIAGSGDREHPLSSTGTLDRIFVLKDLPGNDGSGLTTIVPGHLFDATSVAYDHAAVGSDGSTTPNMGYFKDKLAGEKIVNAPLTVAGYTYYGTNQPADSDSCSANLGIAKGYRLDPLTGTETFTVYDGGGLPPSPVAGVVIVTVEGEDGTSTVPFCIGCGGDPGCVGADCESALGGAKPTINVPTSRTRTYWYREVD
ncbi:MAG: PilC/PilY family type IV pilus protein [Gallionella sp.]|nr:PilC/PilY family type IV pilus protein [Gallionella sp.]